MQKSFFSGMDCPCGFGETEDVDKCSHLEKVRDALIECEEFNRKNGKEEKGISLSQIQMEMRNKKKPGKDRRYLKMDSDLKKGNHKRECVCGDNILVGQDHKKNFILKNKNEEPHDCKDIKQTKKEVKDQKEKRKRFLSAPILKDGSNVQEIPGGVTIVEILKKFARHSTPYISIINKQTGREFDDLSSQSLDAKEERKRKDSGSKTLSGGKRTRWCIFIREELKNQSSLTGRSKYGKDILKTQKIVERRMKQTLSDIEKFDNTGKFTERELKRFKAEVLAGIVDVMTLRGKFLLEIAIRKDEGRNIQLGSKEHTIKIMEAVKDLDENLIGRLSNSILADVDGEKALEFFEKGINATYEHNREEIRSDYYMMTDSIKTENAKKRHGITIPGELGYERRKKAVKNLINKK